MEGGRLSGVASRQDGSEFEDSLRRLNALEKKLTDQVHVDIAELRRSWVQVRVDRVTQNTFKLYQVREHLKYSKVLYVEEEQILGEFNKVKEALLVNSLDDETFEATKETCMVLGGKLGNIRKRQTRCYSDTSDLEMVINKDIMALNFEDKDFQDLDINQVRASTPVRQLSPTPLDRHRSRSREPSEFRMPAMKLCTGTITPGGSIPPDPHAYFSRPGSSQSMYGGKQGGDMDAFRTAMEAKQAEAGSPITEKKDKNQHKTTLSNSSTDKIEVRSASGQIITKPDESDLLLPEGVFVSERPGSAMSDMSIDIDIVSRPGSKLEFLGDEISGKIVPFLEFVIDQELGEKNQTAEKIAEKTDILELEASKVFEGKETTRKNARMLEEEDKVKEEKMRREKEKGEKEKEEKIQEDHQKNKEVSIKRKKDVENKDQEKVEEMDFNSQAKEEIKVNLYAVKKEELVGKDDNAEYIAHQEEDITRKKMAMIKEEEKAKEEKIRRKKDKDAKDSLAKEDEKKIKGVAKKEKKDVKNKEQEKEKNHEVEENQNQSQNSEEIQRAVKDNITRMAEESALITSEDKKKISEACTMKVVNNESKTLSPTPILKGGKGSRDSSKDRKTKEDILNEEVSINKTLSKSGSLKKSSSFHKEKKRISFDDDIDIEKFQVDAEPISLAKEIFAEIADASIEAGLTGTKYEFLDTPSSSPIFNQDEPAEWYPPEGNDFENEDELMIILDDEEPELVALGPVKSRSHSKDRPGSRNSLILTGFSKPGLKQSRSASRVPELEVVEVSCSLKQIIGNLHGEDSEVEDSKKDEQAIQNIALPRSQSQQRPMSTGFIHLDEFERKLAEMEQELEIEEALRNKCETIEDGLLKRTGTSWDLSPTFPRTNTDNDLKLEESYDNDETYDVISNKKTELTRESLAEAGFLTNQEIGNKDESFYEPEDDVLSEYIFDEITGQSIKRFKKVSFAAGEERHELQSSGQKTGKVFENQDNKEPVAPRRSTSKEPTPKTFLSAMTGGLIESNKNGSGSVFGSLIPKGRKSSRSRSRNGSRQSSGERSSQDLCSEDEGSRRSLDICDSASDVASENSLVIKLKKLTKKRPKVQAADFDELFARGMALSAHLGLENCKDRILADQQELFKLSLNPAGIGYNEKVLSYLDDQGQPQSNQSNGDLVNGQGHISRERGRKKHRQQSIQQPIVSMESKARSMSTEQRKRSREYAKPEEIKLSPVPKRDLFTGFLVPESQEAIFLQRVTDFVAKNQIGYMQKAIQITNYEDKTDQNLKPNQDIPLPDRISPMPIPRSPHTLAPSPGKSFLEANTGQEAFGASIEGELIELKPEPETIKDDVYNALKKKIQLPTSALKYSPPRQDEPADKGIPTQLIPDKLLANEEFYENLRFGLKSTEDTIQLDSESFQKYSHHLGRAEFGTLKKSADGFKPTVVSRDQSADKKLNSNSKLSHQSSKDQIQSDSRMSDYSTELPDLEVDDAIKTNDVEVGNVSNLPIHRTQSLIIGSEQEERPVTLDSTAEVLVLRGEVLKEIEERKQQIKDTKAWIQNGLITVVGFGVMAYLQTLEAVAGGQ